MRCVLVKIYDIVMRKYVMKGKTDFFFKKELFRTNSKLFSKFEYVEIKIIKITKFVLVFPSNRMTNAFIEKSCMIIK